MWLKRLREYFSPEARHPRLMPESTYIVELSETGVTCRKPDGRVEQVAWADLESVAILGTSDGPFLPDQFWLLRGREGTNSGCMIPWGATGEQELLARLQELPGFDNESVIGAASSTDDYIRTCWEAGK